MSISSFIIRVIFLALPGLLAASLYRKLKGKKTQKDWEDVIEIALFSIISYGIYGLLAVATKQFGCIPASFKSFEAFSNEAVSLPWHEIILSSLIGLALAIAAARVYTKQLINRLGQAMRVTNRIGDDDLWNYLNHHLNPEIGWVFVRDHKLGLLYYGWIKVASESGEEREMILTDVDVYENATSKRIYGSKLIYLCRQRYDLTIEVPASENEGIVGKGERS